MVAATLALAPAELREQLMLGDAGANPLGAAVGVAAVHAAGDTGWIWGAAGLVVAVNVAGELVSFSRVIARVAPLRMLDELGRRR
jgi:UDP-GlcNAc:undecaprenyl-phosphate/decaprenyl-phosphate GlcNAc-1-phosphate transferase